MSFILLQLMKMTTQELQAVFSFIKSPKRRKERKEGIDGGIQKMDKERARDLKRSTGTRCFCRSLAKRQQRALSGHLVASSPPPSSSPSGLHQSWLRKDGSSRD